MSDLLTPIYFMLPIFFANVAAHQLGGGTPVDLGRNFYDGKRIIGDGKTYRGLLGGIAIGTMTSILQPHLYPTIYRGFFSSFLFGLIVCLGAVTGDLVKSFFKRRMGIERGKPFILVDQSDFVWGALIFYYTWGRLLLEDFYVLSEEWLMIILIVSPLIHFCGNVVAYKLKLKEIWW